MTTDTAAVALAEAIDATIGKTYLHDPAAPYSGMAEGIQQYLNSRGIHLQSWNHDMSQAPRDGTPITISVMGKCLKPWQFTSFWVKSSGNWHDLPRDMQPTAWCHLLPPPKVGDVLRKELK